MSILRLLASVFSLLSLLASLFNQWRWKQAGREEILSEVNKKEAENARKTSEILASPRTPDDTAGRLRDGSF